MALVVVVQHVAAERPYAIGTALTSAGVDVDVRQVFAAEPLPADASELDGLVVMGGPMSAISDDGFPTRRAELDLLEDALDRGIPTLGVCLGAQLLARAAGGSVGYGDAGPEIGWAPVQLTAAAAGDALLAGCPTDLTVLHWHGDTFALPPGAVHLASNDRYANQAFRLGEHAWGFQFHLEVDRSAVTAFLRDLGGEAVAAGSDPAVIDAQAGGCLELLAPVRDRIVARFADLVLQRAGAADLLELS